MLTEARVLGLRDDTLILGHTTGALAHRINDEAKNKDIAAVLAEKTGTTLKVECIVGTSPEAAGLPPLAQPRQAWNPNQPARETDDKEAESPNQPQPSDAPSTPAPEPSVTPGPTSASGWGAPRPIGEEAESTESAESPQEPAESSPQPTARKGWGSPRPIGEEAQPAQQEAHHHLPPRPDPTPHLRREEAAEAHPQQPMASSAPASQQQPQEDKPDWRSRIAQAAESKRQAYEEWNKHTPSFSDGVPLPPDPGPEEDFAPPEFLPPDPEAGQAPPRPDMQQLQQSAPQQAQPAQPAQTSQPAQQQPQRMPQRPAATQPESAASAAQARMAAARTQANGGVGASASAAAPGAPVDRDEEERMMVEEARTAGQHDHRTAMEVAVELLEQELGARRA